MKFPILLRRGLSQEHEERWRQYYLQPSDRDRKREDGIWRRTQQQWNAAESGWRCPSDQRRRIVYYTHEYDLQRIGNRTDLVLRNTYIYYSLSLPEHEVFPELKRVEKALEQGGWYLRTRSDFSQQWILGELICSLSYVLHHPEDLQADRALPTTYRTLDVALQSGDFAPAAKRLPWEVLAKGIRKKDTRGRPTYVSDLSHLARLCPFHVEVGCGPSIEAGIPALHHLHDIYRVTNTDAGQFIFGGQQDDLIERLLLRPSSEFPKLGELFQSGFIAEPTLAHKSLLALREAGHLVGPIMTNNFDGLAHRVGLREHFLRRYDEAVPEVEFSSEAKSLLVIGSHADRRRVQTRARDRGLQVVFLDPEGYRIDGRFVEYPLEGPRDGDLVCRQTATEGLTSLCSLLGIRP